MRRTRTALAISAGVLAVAAAGCGGSSHPSSSPTTPVAGTTAPTTGAAVTTVPANAPTTSAPAQVTTTAPSGPTTVAPMGRCTTSQLQLSLTNEQGAAGSTYATLNLLNRGSSTCTLTGYPGVSFVTGSTGTQVGPGATRTPGSVTTVTLAPGHAGQATVRFIDPGAFDPSQCKAVSVTGLRVYPPGETAAGFVAHPGAACSGTGLTQPTLFVGPVVPGPADGGTGATAS